VVVNQRDFACKPSVENKNLPLRRIPPKKIQLRIALPPVLFLALKMMIKVDKYYFE